MEKLLSCKEVARELEISPHVIRNWIARGNGPKHYWTPGGHRRFKIEDVKEWYADHHSIKKEV